MSREKSMDYGIGTVARLTGLTTHTIRAWEKRHGAIAAARDASGRRRYTPADVERLTKLKRLVDLGERIGGLAQRSLDELDERLTALDTGAAPPPMQAAPLRTGLYGAGVEASAKLIAERAGQVEIVDIRNDATPAQLVAATVEADCLLFMTASVAPAIVADLETLARRDPRQSVILLYAFARDEDLLRLATAGVIIVRSPASAADLRRALDDAVEKRSAATALDRALDTSAARRDPGETPRFTAEELTRIGSISTSIDCECPHHLATVISNLRAFERYSADCAHRDAEDAAMHQYLYRETVRANQVIENALRQLMAYEGIELPRQPTQGSQGA